MSTRVVAVVLLRDFPDGVRRVLACRRTKPAALAGKWEFPGGKVEPGEDDRTALRREINEELAVDLAELSPLGGELPMVGGPGVWQPYVARFPPDHAEPQLLDHDEHRWLGPDELHDVGWLTTDVPILGAIQVLLLTRH